MNEEQVLAQLRDIHLPAALEDTVTTELAGWPFAVLALVGCLILVTRFCNQNRWRRRARADLSGILSVEDRAVRWRLLLEFATGLGARSGRSVVLPQTAFMRPDDLSEAQRAEFVRFLSAQLER